MRIRDSALVAAATLSDRYIADRFLPDKAIDLMDESAAKMRVEMTSKPESVDRMDRKVMQLEMERLSLQNDQTKCVAAPLVYVGMPVTHAESSCELTRAVSCQDTWQVDEVDVYHLQCILMFFFLSLEPTRIPLGSSDPPTTPVL